MSDMKCPFCQQEMEQGDFDMRMFGCTNQNCEHSIHARTEYAATKAIWQELIRTRKALEKAKKSLQELKDIIACPPDISYETGVSMYADGVLQEITALEQKDAK